MIGMSTPLQYEDEQEQLIVKIHKDLKMEISQLSREVYRDETLHYQTTVL